MTASHIAWIAVLTCQLISVNAVLAQAAELTTPARIQDWFFYALTPLLIACGALLAMVSLRSSDLATRFRAAVDRLETESDPRRRRLISHQKWWFFGRYFFCSISFIAMTFAIGAFSWAAFQLHQDPSPDRVFNWAQWGMRLLSAGLLILCLEFFVGPLTLLLNHWSQKK